jgi:hypothetical protein
MAQDTRLEKTLLDCFTSPKVDHGQDSNMVDALFAIAFELSRLADAFEQCHCGQEDSPETNKAITN